MISVGERATFQVVEVDCFTPPRWVEQLLGSDVHRQVSTESPWRLTEVRGEQVGWLQIVWPDAARASDEMLQERVRQIYDLLRERLAAASSCHPLRFWNFVPRIHASSPGGMTRYEVFNAGRSAAFADWFATPRFGSRMIAASCVGHRGEDLVVQVLAADAPGEGLENPRQQAAWRYSRRFGPVPPSFARATRVSLSGGSGGRLIIAGTASVIGEDSHHHEDFCRQVEESCANLRALVSGVDPDGSRALECFEQLRIYLARSAERELLIELVSERFPSLKRLELMAADICRPELLVEIESTIDI